MYRPTYSVPPNYDPKMFRFVEKSLKYVLAKNIYKIPFFYCKPFEQMSLTSESNANRLANEPIRG